MRCVLLDFIVASDAFNNFVMDPTKDVAVDSVTEGTATEGLAGAYEGLSNEAYGITGALTETARFFHETFFQ